MFYTYKKKENRKELILKFALLFVIGNIHQGLQKLSEKSPSHPERYFLIFSLFIFNNY